jgi:hypothetical protein
MGFIWRYNNLKKNNMANDIGWGEGACNNDIGWGIAQEYFSCSGSGEAPVGATLMKTGQTTSYRTGDDGDIEAGRATNFTTLESNNPFGNTDRFTDELGRQTYTNNIVIDWSTYNGATVLGYDRTVRGLSTWNTAIDTALTLNTGGFSTGWRLPNIREYQNIFLWEVALSGNPFNYSPMNISTSGNFATSTTRQSTSTQNIFISNSTNPSYGGISKTTTQNWIAVRDFTVTGTTLT